MCCDQAIFFLTSATFMYSRGIFNYLPLCTEISRFIHNFDRYGFLDQ